MFCYFLFFPFEYFHFLWLVSARLAMMDAGSLIPAPDSTIQLPIGIEMMIIILFLLLFGLLLLLLLFDWVLKCLMGRFAGRWPMRVSRWCHVTRPGRPASRADSSSSCQRRCYYEKIRKKKRRISLATPRRCLSDAHRAVINRKQTNATDGSGEVALAPILFTQR